MLLWFTLLLSSWAGDRTSPTVVVLLDWVLASLPTIDSMLKPIFCFGVGIMTADVGTGGIILVINAWVGVTWAAVVRAFTFQKLLNFFNFIFSIFFDLVYFLSFALLIQEENTLFLFLLYFVNISTCLCFSSSLIPFL